MSVVFLNSSSYSHVSDKLYETIDLSKKLYVFHSQNLSNSKYISQDIIQEINSNEAFLLISEDGEWSNWNRLKNTLDFSHINHNNCIIVSANHLFNIKPNSLTKDDCPFKIFFYNVLFAHTVDSFKQRPTSNISSHFSFLSFRDNYLRQYFYYLLRKNNLTPKGFVSHNKFISPTRAIDDNNFFPFLKNYLSSSDFSEFKRISKEKISIDLPNESNNGFPKVQFFSISDAVALEIVVESCVDLGTSFISEKTLKAILNKNLFLLLGSYQSLSVLKKLGFMTFSHIFDESYDNIKHPVHRAEKVYEQLNNFCSLSLEEVIKIKNDNQDVLDYNYNHLVNNLDLTFNLKNKVESYFKGEINGRN